MLPEDAQIISVDDHVIEHRTVWSDRMPRRFADDAPRIVRQDDGNDVWIYEGAVAGNFALNAVVGKDPKDWAMDPRSFDDMLPGCYSIQDRLRDMDTDGVHAQMCFPNMAGFAGRVFADSKDHDLGYECVRAYNDFIIDEWCAAAPDRQIPLVMVPYWDVEKTVAEIYRTAAKGARSFTFPELPDRLGYPSWHNSHWDPVLAAAQEAGLPISLHFGSGGAPVTSQEAVTTNWTVRIAVMGMNSMNALTEILLSPVFHKFPDLQIALPEGGIGWIPYMLERIDYTWDRHRWWNDVNKEVRPSDLFRSNMYGCFISDNAGIAIRHMIGVDNILFESDYPHADSQWPHTRKYLSEALGQVPDDEARKMVEGNARKLFKFPRAAA